MFEPSPARRGFDELLRRYPHFDILYVERGRSDLSAVAAPWVLVTLGQPSEGEIEAFARWEFAIWKNTGAVYRMADGAVEDDPFITVERSDMPPPDEEPPCRTSEATDPREGT